MRTGTPSTTLHPHYVIGGTVSYNATFSSQGSIRYLGFDAVRDDESGIEVEYQACSASGIDWSEPAPLPE